MVSAGQTDVRFNLECTDDLAELGHIMKNCPEEKREREQKVAITCANCNNEGHRARDCPEPRKASRGKGCRNCGQEGHISKECPEPPNPDNVECKNCNKSMQAQNTSHHCTYWANILA